MPYNRARWYDAKVGRWLSEDPIGFSAGDHNLYRYVSNFSTGATDPSGLQFRSPFGWGSTQANKPGRSWGELVWEVFSGTPFGAHYDLKGGPIEISRIPMPGINEPALGKPGDLVEVANGFIDAGKGPKPLVGNPWLGAPKGPGQPDKGGKGGQQPAQGNQPANGGKPGQKPPANASKPPQQPQPNDKIQKPPEDNKQAQPAPGLNPIQQKLKETLEALNDRLRNLNREVARLRRLIETQGPDARTATGELASVRLEQCLRDVRNLQDRVLRILQQMRREF